MTPERGFPGTWSPGVDQVQAHSPGPAPRSHGGFVLVAVLLLLFLFLLSYPLIFHRIDDGRERTANMARFQRIEWALTSMVELASATPTVWPGLSTVVATFTYPPGGIFPATFSVEVIATLTSDATWRYVNLKPFPYEDFGPGFVPAPGFDPDSLEATITIDL